MKHIILVIIIVTMLVSMAYAESKPWGMSDYDWGYAKGYEQGTSKNQKLSRTVYLSETELQQLNGGKSVYRWYDAGKIYGVGNEFMDEVRPPKDTLKIIDYGNCVAKVFTDNNGKYYTQAPGDKTKVYISQSEIDKIQVVE